MTDQSSCSSSTAQQKVANKDVVFDYYFINEDEEERDEIYSEFTNFQAICILCYCDKNKKKFQECIYLDQWRGNGLVRKKWRKTKALQSHLQTHEQVWKTEIEPRLTAGITPRRSAFPTNSTHTGTYIQTEMDSRMGACFRCGLTFGFGVLFYHRRRHSYGSFSGCPMHGKFYEQELAPELAKVLKANCWESLGVDQLLELRTGRIEAFKRFCAVDPHTVPLRLEEMENSEKAHGVYLHVSSCSSFTKCFSSWAYFGRTMRAMHREARHKGGVHYRYITREQPELGHISLHVANDLTTHQAKCLEYLTIQLRDIDTKYPYCPVNIKLPMPYIHHTRTLDAAQLKIDNQRIHTEGRTLASELALIAHLLYIKGHKDHMITTELGEMGDPDEAGILTLSAPDQPTDQSFILPDAGPSTSSATEQSAESPPRAPISPLDRLELDSRKRKNVGELAAELSKPERQLMQKNCLETDHNLPYKPSSQPTPSRHFIF